MANDSVALPFPGGRQLYVDNGDGTYSFAVAVTSSTPTPNPTNGQQVQGNVASGTADAGNPVKIGGVYYGNNGAPTVASGQRTDIAVNIRGQVLSAVGGNLSADGISATINAPQDGSASVRPLGVAAWHFNGSTYDRARGDTTGAYVVQKPSTSGGTSTAKVISAATTNATVVKASAGQLYGLQFSNSGAGWAFVKLYNKSTAPTVGTDTPVEIVGIPPGGRCEINRPLGMPATTGISYAIVGGYADSDTTAVAAGQVIGSIQYA